MFKADTAGSPCQTADARYVVSRTENELHIAGRGDGFVRWPEGGAGGDVEQDLMRPDVTVNAVKGTMSAWSPSLCSR